MEIFKFLGLNIGIAGGIVLVVFIYLVVLINKRRTQKFLHEQDKKKKD
ncbi:MAG TPA: hypothetical protein VL633_09800 [Bacteroidota bacterium]|jgi:hypothetical protein|nr:hypothetical protein [Bacteroidota bacterium]